MPEGVVQARVTITENGPSCRTGYQISHDYIVDAGNLGGTSVDGMEDGVYLETAEAGALGGSAKAPRPLSPRSPPAEGLAAAFAALRVKLLTTVLPSATKVLVVLRLWTC